MGTGTIGYGGASNQTRLGTSPFTRLLLDGYNQNGLRFFDSADSYGSHPYVAAASSNSPATKSPSSPRPTPAIPREFAPTSTATAKN